MGRANRAAAAGLLLAAALTLSAAFPADEPKKRADVSKTPAAETGLLTGTWLFESAWQGTNDLTACVWRSRLTVADDSFELAPFMDAPKGLKGTLDPGPAGDPPALDLNLEAFALPSAAAEVPALTLPAIWKLDGERLTVCLPSAPGAMRPATFDTGRPDTVRLVLARAPAGFRRFPDEVTVAVAGPDGKPATGVTVAGFMSARPDGGGKDAVRSWTYHQPVRTGAGGEARMNYDHLRNRTVIARDPENGRMALGEVSPAGLVRGGLRLALRPECRVSGTVVCEQLKSAGKPVGRTNVTLTRAGRRVAECDSADGRFEFVVPPGTYTLAVRGAEVRAKDVTLVVPAGRDKYTSEPIAVNASVLGLLRGRPAPELEGVLGWKGGPVRLADLRGRFVLLEFWGFWCGPCIGAMPVLIELHERFADKGLAVVGIHVDTDGEVDTAAKLDKNVEEFKAKQWRGKGIPFPVALTSTKRMGGGGGKPFGGVMGQYGVMGFPTTILIDRDGKVVGSFNARDPKAAVAEVEKLLNAKR